MMDTQRDFLPFQKLIGRLCETMGKPCTEELVQSWWKALRNASLTAVEARIDAFIAKADEGTRFPRPAQIRPEGVVSATSDPNPYGESWVRGYWRTVIVETVARMTGQTVKQLEPVLIAQRDIGAEMKALLDDMQDRETRTGQRTSGMEDYCRESCLEIARMLGVSEPWRSGFGPAGLVRS